MGKKYTTDELDVSTVINGTGSVDIGGTVTTTNQGMVCKDHRTTYAMMATKTITNTVVETSHFEDTGAIGTRTFTANFLKAGMVIRLNVRSDFSCTNNPTNTLRVKFGGVTIITSTGQIGNHHTNSYAELQLELVIRTAGATGTMVAQGRTILVGTSDISRRLQVTEPITIDTTVANELDVSYEWGHDLPANILIATNATIQIMN